MENVKEYGVHITSSNQINVIEFKDGEMYEGLRKLVDGWIKHVTITGLESKKICMVVNEEGMLKQLPINFIGTILYGDFIHGDIVICKDGYRDGEPDIIGLTEEEADLVKSVFTDMINALEKANKK